MQCETLGTDLGAHRLEVLLTRSVLVRTMESLGKEYLAEVLEDYEHRMPVSTALKYLSVAIDESPLPEGRKEQGCEFPVASQSRSPGECCAFEFCPSDDFERYRDFSPNHAEKFFPFDSDGRRCCRKTCTELEFAGISIWPTQSH